MLVIIINNKINQGQWDDLADKDACCTARDLSSILESTWWKRRSDHCTGAMQTNLKIKLVKILSNSWITYFWNFPPATIGLYMTGVSQEYLKLRSKVTDQKDQYTCLKIMELIFFISDYSLFMVMLTWWYAALMCLSSLQVKFSLSVHLLRVLSSHYTQGSRYIVSAC